jgi:hypothetical protein
MFFLGGTGVLNSGFYACLADTLLLEPSLQALFVLVILEIGPWVFCLG